LTYAGVGQDPAKLSRNSWIKDIPDLVLAEMDTSKPALDDNLVARKRCRTRTSQKLLGNHSKLSLDLVVVLVGSATRSSNQVIHASNSSTRRAPETAWNSHDDVGRRRIGEEKVAGSYGKKSKPES